MEDGAYNKEYQCLNGLKHGSELLSLGGNIVTINKYKRGLKHGICSSLLLVGPHLEFYENGNEIWQCYFRGDTINYTCNDKILRWQRDALIYEAKGYNKQISVYTKTGEIYDKKEGLIGKLDHIPNNSIWDNLSFSYYFFYGNEHFPLQRKTVEHNADGTGVITRFRPNGKVKSTTNIFLGVRHGYRWIYDVHGHLMYSARYYFDTLQWEKHHHKKTPSLSIDLR